MEVRCNLQLCDSCDQNDDDYANVKSDKLLRIACHTIRKKRQLLHSVSSCSAACCH